MTWFRWLAACFVFTGAILASPALAQGDLAPRTVDSREAASHQESDQPAESTVRDGRDRPSGAADRQHAGETQAEGSREPRPEDARDKVLYSAETEAIKPLGMKLARNTLLDQKDIWTSPFHITRRNARWWIFFGAATGALIATDRDLSRKLPNTADQIAFSRGFSQIGAPYTVVPAAGAFYLAGAIWDNAKARETGALSAEALFDSVIVSGLLKLATGRERPLEGRGNGRFFRGRHGFPSGHATEAWAFASVVAHEYHRPIIIPVVAYSLSALLSASRFSARKHFASDIVAGAAMGWFIGRYVFRTHVDHSIHRRPPSEMSLRLRPEIVPRLDSRTFGLSLVWGARSDSR